MPLNRPILIIEDSPEDYEALARAFAKAKVSNPIYRFSYGEDAFDYLRQRGRFFRRGSEEPPALIVLDLNLPGTDGLRLLREIREDPSLRSLPIVVFSTIAEPREIEACYAAGANTYIVKPSATEELLGIVDKLKTYWLDGPPPASIAEGRPGVSESSASP